MSWLAFSHCADVAPWTGAAANGTTFASAPGRTFCAPSMMTLSPRLKPAATSHWSPSARSVVIDRCWTLPSASTIRVMGFPRGSRDTACWGIRRACSSTPSSMTARMNMPGNRSLAGLGTTIRKMTDPVVGSTVISRNSSVPSKGDGVPSSRTSLTLLALSPFCWRPCSRRRFNRNSSMVDCGTST